MYLKVSKHDSYGPVALYFLRLAQATLIRLIHVELTLKETNRIDSIESASNRNIFNLHCIAQLRYIFKVPRISTSGMSNRHSRETNRIEYFKQPNIAQKRYIFYVSQLPVSRVINTKHESTRIGCIGQPSLCSSRKRYKEPCGVTHCQHFPSLPGRTENENIFDVTSSYSCTSRELLTTEKTTSLG